MIEKLAVKNSFLHSLISMKTKKTCLFIYFINQRDRRGRDRMTMQSVPITTDRIVVKLKLLAGYNSTTIRSGPSVLTGFNSTTIRSGSSVIDRFKFNWYSIRTVSIDRF